MRLKHHRLPVFLFLLLIPAGLVPRADAQSNAADGAVSTAEPEILSAPERSRRDVFTANPLLQASRALAQTVEKVTPAVVHIQAQLPHETRGTVQETGSGVLTNSPKVSGVFVVTNRHVILGAEPDDIAIQLHDGRVIHPVRVWTDPATDLALLQVTARNLQTAVWGDSDEVRIGHAVLAMGSPFGLSRSVSFGIISAKGRRSLNLGKRNTAVRTVINQDFLQTDAAINPGNSGGPLIDLQGRIIGINTAIASNSGGNDGIGFSIPSNLVQHIIDELVVYGKVRRAYLGVTLDSRFVETKARQLGLDRRTGARVLEVHTETPASRAGLQYNDVILKLGGVAIEDENHLIHVVSLTPIGKDVELLVLRDGRRIAVTVHLGDRADLERRAGIEPRREENRIDGLKPIRPSGVLLQPIDADVRD